uniref:CHAT domain-containing protein n=1 Tax=viral metagenome TaxID=1070528 RepID=A0A6M3MGW3_9ZZZZ
MKATVEAALEGVPEPNWFVHYDHGSDYAMWGDDEKPIINLDNLAKLAGKHVYCMNCSSGKGLGTHAIAKGILEYLGYNDVVSFTTDAADEFGEVFNWGLVKAIKTGSFLKDIVEDMRQHGYDIAADLSGKGQLLAAGSMVQDMNILHVYYEGGPAPPGPSCPISSALLKLGGWNFLWFCRMLRQKLYPESRPG